MYWYDREDFGNEVAKYGVSSRGFVVLSDKEMDCSDFSCNQNMDYRNLYVAGGDHVTSAQANANYFYQLYLWWWHTTNAWHAPINPFWSNQSVEPVCECTESYLNERNDCDAYQNSNDRVIQTKIMQCEYCPQVFHTQLQMRSRTAGESMNETFSEMWLNDEAVGCEVLSDAGNVGNGDDYNDEGDYDEDDDDDDDIGIEVDDHFRKFLEESEKHRQEREKSELLLEKH